MPDYEDSREIHWLQALGCLVCREQPTCSPVKEMSRRPILNIANGKMNEIIQRHGRFYFFREYYEPWIKCTGRCANCVSYYEQLMEIHDISSQYRADGMDGPQEMERN